MSQKAKTKKSHIQVDLRLELSLPGHFQTLKTIHEKNKHSTSNCLSELCVTIQQGQALDRNDQHLLTQ